MLSKKQIQFLKRLHQKKNRQKEGLFLVEGRKNVSDLLESKFKIHSVYFTADNFDFFQSSTQPKVNQFECAAGDFGRFSYLKSPDGIAAVAYIPEPMSCNGLQKTVLLEDINDPGNLGTLMRSADWFGLDAVLVSRNTTDAYSPKSVQAAKGSLFRIPVIPVDLHTEVKHLVEAGTPIFAMDMDGRDIDTIGRHERFGILLGNEANGLRPEMLKLATERVRIEKISTKSAIDSLNVGIAGSIAMFALSKSGD